MHIYMQSVVAEGKQPRFYQILLQQDLISGWTLITESGQQGSSGRVKREHHNNREEAESALIRVRDNQLRRGYRVVFAKGEARPE